MVVIDMDMPERCGDCPFMIHGNDGEVSCSAVNAKRSRFTTIHLYSDRVDEKCPMYKLVTVKMEER